MVKRIMIITMMITCFLLTSCTHTLTKNGLKREFINDFREVMNYRLKKRDIIIVGQYGNGYVLQVHYPDETGDVTWFDYRTFALNSEYSLYYYEDNEIYDMSIFYYSEFDDMGWIKYSPQMINLLYCKGIITWDDLLDMGKKYDSEYLLSKKKYLVEDCEFEFIKEKKCIHKNRDFVIKNVTCTESGIRELQCVDCKKILDVSYAPPGGHTYIDGVCEKCGYIKSETVEEDPVFTASIQNTTTIDLNFVAGIRYNGKNYYLYEMAYNSNGFLWAEPKAESFFKNKYGIYFVHYNILNFYDEDYQWSDNFDYNVYYDLHIELKEMNLWRKVYDNYDDYVGKYDDLYEREYYYQCHENVVKNLTELDRFNLFLKKKYFSIDEPPINKFYYGTYNDLFVFYNPYENYEKLKKEKMIKKTIGSYEFEYYDWADISVSDGDCLMSLEDAWENKLLDLNDIAKIYEKHINNDMIVFE